MQLEGTRGHRFIAYCATSGTPDHDKVVLLDLAEPQPVPAAPPTAERAG